MTSLRIAGLLIATLPLTLGAAPPSESTSARQLTVEVFSTQILHSLDVTPMGSGASAREHGGERSPALPMRLDFTAGAIRLTSRHDSRTVKTIELDGSWRLQPEDGEPPATAAGVWSIRSAQAGLQVLLVLPSERYVMAALDGEASPDEPLESLKAMAVAMRTFALKNANRHAAQGFGLCDSTHCQALRWGKSRPEVERAVQETAGETLWAGKQRARIYYTQNCGGITEDAKNVWPDERAGYLVSHPDPYCVRGASAEWHTTIPLGQIGAIFRKQGWSTPSRIDSIRVTRKSSSGRALMLEVKGNGAAAAISASSFRFAVNRELGWNRLRSDWYAMRVSGGVLQVDGRGYGHGVGLCQAGAFQMATEGHGYAEILKFYFPGTIPRVDPEDTGWKTREGDGWMLLAASPSTELLKEGDSAWNKAQALFPSSAPVHPTVQAMPTTELFRQTTGEPGWMLASTQGSNVFLQPLAVLRKNGAGEELLLHEFLHVQVEQEAGPQTPLWLREGLAEELATGTKAWDATSVTVAEVEAALAHPSDAAASRRAHLAAAGMTNHLVEQYGMATVRGWLRTGVPSHVVESLGAGQ